MFKAFPKSVRGFFVKKIGFLISNWLPLLFCWLWWV